MRYVLRHGRFSHQLLRGILAGLMLLGPTGISGAQNSGPPVVDAEPDATLLADPPQMPVAFDVSYVLPQSFLVVAARPSQVLKSPVMEMLPYEVVQAATIQATGIDPMTADQVVFCVTPPFQGPPQYTALAKFTEPASLDSEELTGHTAPAEIDGKEYLRSGDPMAPSFFHPDANSLLLAPDGLLPSLLGDGVRGASNNLKAKAAAAQRDDLVVLLDVAAVRPFIQMGLAQADLPPQAQPLTEIPNLISQAELRLNVTGQGNTELIFTANDEDDAREVQRIVNDFKRQAMAMASQGVQHRLASEDPVERALGRYQQRMRKMGDEKLQLEIEDDRIVVFRLDPNNAGQNQQLVYAATIGVLVALLLPAVQAAREAARRNSSMNNMKQLILGMLNYESARGEYPAHAVYGDGDKPLLSWRVAILPYLEHQALYNRFHLDEPWDSEHNRKLIPLMPAVFLDPSSGLSMEEGKTHYLGPLGPGTLFTGKDRGRQIREVTDGTSNTIALVQVSDDGAAIWTKPDDWKFDPENPLRDLGGLHPGIFQAVFCDGHVRSISEAIDLDALRALMTVDGGEIVPNF
ncbi:DUF1559 domain-containing protein [Pirellulales bacterium]|nr:DUF1559 domain-containing protein [Pirellulales bacterium]